jgi:hypothetical protein
VFPQILGGWKSTGAAAPAAAVAAAATATTAATRDCGGLMAACVGEEKEMVWEEQ